MHYFSRFITTTKQLMIMQNQHKKLTNIYSIFLIKDQKTNTINPMMKIIHSWVVTLSCGRD